MTCVMFHEFKILPLCYQLSLFFTELSLREWIFNWRLWDFFTSFWTERVKLFWRIQWPSNKNDANCRCYLITFSVVTHFLVIYMKNTSSIFKMTGKTFLCVHQRRSCPTLMKLWDYFSIYQCSPNQNTFKFDFSWVVLYQMFHFST